MKKKKISVRVSFEPIINLTFNSITVGYLFFKHKICYPPSRRYVIFPVCFPCARIRLARGEFMLR